MTDNPKNKEKFRVLLAEDHKYQTLDIIEKIEAIGGVVVEVVKTVADAKEAIKILEELKINLVILGGSLDGGYKPGSPDSVLLLQLILEQATKVKTIIYSADIYTENVKGADATISKFDPDELAPAILRVLADANSEVTEDLIESNE